MVEIQTLPERGCGRLSYVWICCSCVEHMGGSHPRCGADFNCTCIGCAISTGWRIWLAIRLGVEGSGLGELGVQR
jgi:hypothetical protein